MNDNYKVGREIQGFFNDRNRNDLLLLYFSCHGVKDEDGRLYYAATDTDRKFLASTAISSIFVNERMERSRSRRQVLVIDCCYSGAFVKGFLTRADKKIYTREFFEQGHGKIVLTASDSMQYSFEEDKLEPVEVNKPGSIFTRAIVEGLATGNADLNEDGLVSYDELYDYISDRVTLETPNQSPQKWVFGVEGDVFIAKNPYKRLLREASNYLKKGDYNATIEYSDKAIKLKPADALAYNIKGRALFSLRQYREALACYEKLDANDANVWNLKGLAFHGLGKYEDAIASYDKAIILRPDYTEAVNNRKSSYSEIKKKQQVQQQQQQVGTTTTSDRIRTEGPNVVESKQVSSFPIPVVQRTNWWEQLRVQMFLEYVRRRHIVPIIGPGVGEPWIPPADVIANRWAVKYNYPLRLTGPDQLPRVAQFLVWRYEDSTFPKKILRDELRQINPPDFHLKELRNTPHVVLADLNLPIYITTNYDHLLEESLKSQGKQPISDFCRWSEDLVEYAKQNEINSTIYKDLTNYQPTPAK